MTTLDLSFLVNFDLYQTSYNVLSSNAVLDVRPCPQPR